MLVVRAEPRELVHCRDACRRLAAVQRLAAAEAKILHAAGPVVEDGVHENAATRHADVRAGVVARTVDAHRRLREDADTEIAVVSCLHATIPTRAVTSIRRNRRG